MAVSLSVMSCQEDDITLRPHDAVNEATVLRTVVDFQNAVRGSYLYMYKEGGQSGYGGEFLIDSEVMTDNLIFNPGGRQTNLDGFRWQDNSINTHFNYYESAYRSSEMASKVINNIGTLAPGAERDNIEGEARFLRAINHFDLVRIYSKIPTQSADALGSLGVYYLSTFEPNVRPSRPTVQESYDKILQDLLLAKDLISANNNVATGHASKAAVNGVLSRVYLYLGQYQNAINAADAALSTATGAMGNIPGIAAGATPEANLVKLWDDQIADGVLFKLVIKDAESIIPGTVYYQGAPNARKSEYVVSKELIDLYSDTDIRKKAYTANSKYAGKFYNHIIKYDGRPGGTANVVDIKVVRMEEVLLNKAEAEYRLNGGGLATIDLLRSKRYTNFAAGSETGQALLDAILLERILELAFEMDRFFTLKRLNMDMVRSETDGQFADGSGIPANVTFIPAGDYKWQLPISKFQRDLNPNLQQNPGY